MSDLKSASCIGRVNAVGPGKIYVAGKGEKKESVKEAGEEFEARSVLSLTDRYTGLRRRFCAGEFFTLGLMSGMCELRVVL